MFDVQYFNQFITFFSILISSICFSSVTHLFLYGPWNLSNVQIFQIGFIFTFPDPRPCFSPIAAAVPLLNYVLGSGHSSGSASNFYLNGRISALVNNHYQWNISKSSPLHRFYTRIRTPIIFIKEISENSTNGLPYRRKFS